MYHSLKYPFKGKLYSFNSFFGLLLSRKINVDNHKSKRVYDNLLPKVAEALAIVEDPYKVVLTRSTVSYSDFGKILKWYGQLLIWLHRHFYPGLWLVSHLRLNVFASAEEAIDVFCRIHPKDQKLLCLPRSVFGATLSRKFKKEGVLFIGVFLPSHRMHAYVIESGYNAYRHDYDWINYTPVSIMT